MKRELCRIEDEQGRCAVWMSLAGGTLRVERLDTGAGPQAMLGGDYKSWVEIPSEALAALAFALLSERMAGNLQAVADTASFCVQHGIAHEKGSWS